jgi:hypothetical protein
LNSSLIRLTVTHGGSVYISICLQEKRIRGHHAEVVRQGRFFSTWQEIKVAVIEKIHGGSKYCGTELEEKIELGKLLNMESHGQELSIYTSGFTYYICIVLLHYETPQVGWWVNVVIQHVSGYIHVWS